jgi:ATP-dependent Clp protease ATP-binding subunit ClpA
MSHSKTEHLRGLESYLRSQVIGQDDAISRVSRALEASECGLNDTGPRPRGAFLFMGPTGVGKTSCCKAFNEHLLGSSRLTMLYMNEMQSPNDVGDLVRTIKLGVEAHPNGTTFLFDEIEKAHRAIIDVFLSLLDEGQVTAPDGERISVCNCYVVMTSNIGAQRWTQMEQTTYSVMESFAYDQARKILRPELFNRLTETVVFRPLSQETQIGILNQMLGKKLMHVEVTLEKIFGTLPSPLSIDEKSVNAHLLRKGFTQTGGARRLRQELDRQFNIATMPWIFSGQVPQECRFFYDAKNDRLELR